MPRNFLSTTVSERFFKAVQLVAHDRMIPVSVLLRQALAELLRDEGHDVALFWEPRKRRQVRS